MSLFDRINQVYSDSFKKFGYSSAAVQIPKNNQSVRFDSVLNFLPESGSRIMTIADFGCGLGHLNDYLLNKFQKPFRYTGVDINADFIEFNKVKHPSSSFFAREDFFDNGHNYDVITSVGTFNIVYGEDETLHKDFVYSEILKLWDKTNLLLHLNFMSTIVDFTQVGAYHQDVGDLYAFLCKNASRNIIIDSSYLPYEFSAIVRKE
jgi:SAM-dependent methyltransferase